MKYEDFIQPIAIAMRSQFLVATAVAHHMLERRSGVILAITATPKAPCKGAPYTVYTNYRPRT